jgi:C4-dicarboxylate-specific signal transduction histidine kinase
MMELEHEGEVHSHLLRWAQLTCAGEVASIVAHDINNAVTGVMSYAELAQMDLPSWSESGPHLDKALEQARRVSTLANRLLALSHESPPYPGPLDLQANLEVACGLVQRRLEKDRIAFDSVLEVEGIQVIADLGRLLQCWLSLIFLGRGALLQSGASAGRCLSLIARRQSDASGERAQIQIVAAGAGLPLFSLEGIAALAERDRFPARESVLYAAVAAHLGELCGTLHAEQNGERLVLRAGLPVSG